MTTILILLLLPISLLAILVLCTVIWALFEEYQITFDLRKYWPQVAFCCVGIALGWLAFQWHNASSPYGGPGWHDELPAIEDQPPIKKKHHHE